MITLVFREPGVIVCHLEDKSCTFCKKRVTKTEIEGRADHKFKSIRTWGILCSYKA